MSLAPSHGVDLKGRAKFLHRLMVELAGDACMSVEGDLSRCQFPEEFIASLKERPPLVRDTLWPKQGFVILRLTPDSVEPIYKQIMAAGLKRAILHVKIERGGALQLAAHDNFGDGCCTGPEVSVSLLEELKKEGVVRSFEPVQK